MSEPLANLNGVTMPLSEVKVSALDRGFLFGDAIYEVLRVYSGRPWLEDEHFERLARSLEAVRIRGVDVTRVRRHMHETLIAAKAAEATVYIQVTRGAAPRSHAFPANATPLELLWVAEFRDGYAEARRTGAAVSLQPDIRWDRCDIKSINLLGNVLAMQAAKEAGCVEAVLYLQDGTLTEASHNSFFGVLDGIIRTAPNHPGILPGCTRGLVLRLAAEAGLRVREEPLRRDDLPRVSELFLTGTTSEVLPVTRVDDRTVADGRPGRITLALQEAYDRLVREFRSVESM
jgi:D-alanine transaminase